jgi:hypothetical protein
MSGRIDILPYALRLAQEYRWAKGVQTERSGLLVRVLAWGCEGFGESAPPIHLAIDAATMAEEARAFVAAPLTQTASPALFERGSPRSGDAAATQPAPGGKCRWTPTRAWNAARPTTSR